jgi:AraC-like DNA-binding protein/mannose-6-phosphate isomerase-like protein (cupin superfamily)
MKNPSQNRRNSRSSDAAPIREYDFGGLLSLYPASAAAGVPIVLFVDDVDRDQWDCPRRHRDFMSLYIARQGRGIHVIDEIPYEVVRGDVYAMAAGMTHQFSQANRLILDTIHFLPSVFDAATVNALAATPGFTSLFVEEPLNRRAQGDAKTKWLHLPPSAYGTASEMFAELRREWEACTPDGFLLTHGLFLRLLIFLAREYAAGQGMRAAVVESGHGAHDRTVAMAVRYIDEQFADPIRVDELASSFFLSPGRFTEVFRSVMGCAPRDYLKHVRIEHAKTLVATTGLSVTEIAARCGYPDPAHFTRQFRECTGMSPRECRTRQLR